MSIRNPQSKFFGIITGQLIFSIDAQNPNADNFMTLTGSTLKENVKKFMKQFDQQKTIIFVVDRILEQSSLDIFNQHLFQFIIDCNTNGNLKKIYQIIILIINGPQKIEQIIISHENFNDITISSILQILEDNLKTSQYTKSQVTSQLESLLQTINNYICKDNNNIQEIELICMLHGSTSLTPINQQIQLFPQIQFNLKEKEISLSIIQYVGIKNEGLNLSYSASFMNQLDSLNKNKESLSIMAFSELSGLINTIIQNISFPDSQKKNQGIQLCILGDTYSIDIDKEKLLKQDSSVYEFNDLLILTNLKNPSSYQLIKGNDVQVLGFYTKLEIIHENQFQQQQNNVKTQNQNQNAKNNKFSQNNQNQGRQNNRIQNRYNDEEVKQQSMNNFQNNNRQSQQQFNQNLIQNVQNQNNKQNYPIFQGNNQRLQNNQASQFFDRSLDISNIHNNSSNLLDNSESLIFGRSMRDPDLFNLDDDNEEIKMNQFQEQNSMNSNLNNSYQINHSSLSKQMENNQLQNQNQISSQNRNHGNQNMRELPEDEFINEEIFNLNILMLNDFDNERIRKMGRDHIEITPRELNYEDQIQRALQESLKLDQSQNDLQKNMKLLEKIKALEQDHNLFPSNIDLLSKDLDKNLNISNQRNGQNGLIDRQPQTKEDQAFQKLNVLDYSKEIKKMKDMVQNGIRNNQDSQQIQRSLNNISENLYKKIERNKKEMRIRIKSSVPNCFTFLKYRFFKDEYVDISVRGINQAHFTMKKVIDKFIEYSRQNLSREIFQASKQTQIDNFTVYQVILSIIPINEEEYQNNSIQPQAIQIERISNSSRQSLVQPPSQVKVRDEINQDRKSISQQKGQFRDNVSSHSNNSNVMSQSVSSRIQQIQSQLNHQPEQYDTSLSSYVIDVDTYWDKTADFVKQENDIYIGKKLDAKLLEQVLLDNFYNNNRVLRLIGNNRADMKMWQDAVQSITQNHQYGVIAQISNTQTFRKFHDYFKNQQIVIVATIQLQWRQ